LRLSLVFGVLVVSGALVSCSNLGLTRGGGSDAFKVDLSRGNAEAETYANYLSARFAATEHNLSDAAKYYRVSLERDPGDANLMLLAFFYSTSAGDVDSAAELAKRVVAKTTDDRAARLTLAVAAFKHHDFAGARQQLQQSAKGPFTNLTSAILDAWASAGEGDAKSALSDLQSLSGATGADALTAFHLALIDEFLGRTQEADAAYRDALLKAGPSPRIVEAYGRFLARSGRWADASALYAKLERDLALAPVIADRRADIADRKAPGPMVEHAEEGAAEALFGIAGSLSDQSSADISILYLRLALYLRPDLALGNILLGDRLEALQKYDDAIAAYRNVRHESPYWRLAAVQIAIDEARSNKTDQAVIDLKKLTVDSPDDIEAWTALGDSYRSGEHWADAASAYDRAVKLIGKADKKDWPLFYARAIAEERSRRWDSAEQDLKTALTLSPDEPQVLNYLGYSWVDQGRNIPAALAMLEKARQLKPFDGYIVDSVGWAYFKLGRYDDAAKALEDAILLVPGDPTINDHLGDAFWRVGKRLDARFQWNHALAFGPDADEKSALEKKLKDGLSPGKPT
jgi:tetratricopeptide (TPR) repeat protein